MQRNHIARGFASAALIAVALSIAGCSQGERPPSLNDTPAPVTNTQGADDVEAALDDYVAFELKNRDQVMAAYGDLYSDFTVVAEYPHTVVYTYTFKEEPDMSDPATIDTMQTTLDQGAHDAIFPSMSNMGVRPSQEVKFVYLNPNGSEAFSYTVSSS